MSGIINFYRLKRKLSDLHFSNLSKIGTFGHLQAGIRIIDQPHIFFYTKGTVN